MTAASSTMPAEPPAAVRHPPGSHRSGRIGVALTLAGATAVLVSFTALNWVTVEQSNGSESDDAPDLVTKTFNAIRIEREVSTTSVLAQDYVTWLGWTLLAAVTVAGVLAGVTGLRARSWQIAGVAVGAGGALLTWLATVRFYKDPPLVDFDTPFPAYTGFAGADAGAHLAFAGFVIAGVGAAIGPLGTGRPAGSVPLAARVRRSVPQGSTAVAAGLAVLAGLLLLGGYGHAAWYDTSGRDLPEHFGFGSFASYVNADPAVVVQAYFTGLAYATAVAAVAGALVAAGKGAPATVGRGVAVAAGLAGIVLVPWALAALLSGPNPPFDGIWDGPAVGPFLVVAGYLLAVVAALLSARTGPGSDT